MNIAVYCVIAFVLYGIQFLFLSRGIKRLRCTRAFSRTNFFAGESGELVETVRNDSLCIIPWLRLESQLSPHLQLGSQSNLQVSHDMYYSSLFTLMPYQQIRRTHRIKFLRRGVYDLGNAYLTIGDMLDVFRYSQPRNLPTEVMVYPALLEPEQLPPLLTMQMGELSRRRQLLQDPFLIRGIRPYVPGDPVRDIHWPATARTGQTQLRIRDYTARTRLLVILNMQAEEMQWQDALPERQADAMEHAISLVATLCTQTLQSGLAAGFGTNASADDSRGTILLPPQEGSARTEEIFSVLARLNTSRNQHFPLYLETLKAHTGLDIFVLSMYCNEEIREAMRQLEQCGNRVTFHLLEGGVQ